MDKHDVKEAVRLRTGSLYRRCLDHRNLAYRRFVDQPYSPPAIRTSSVIRTTGVITARVSAFGTAATLARAAARGTAAESGRAHG